MSGYEPDEETAIRSADDIDVRPQTSNAPPEQQQEEDVVLDAMDQVDPMTLPPVREEHGLEDDDEDIYRGERPPSLRTFTGQREPDADASSIATSSSSSSSSSSSNSSLNIGRKLGGLAAVVEQAISRWARKHSSASSVSSGSSSTSSASSTPRTVTTRRRRRRRNSSTLSLKSAEHERVLLARKRARARLRVSPREFVLLEPPHLAQMHQVAGNDVLERTIRTTSMPLVLSHLEDALKKSSKPHRVPPNVIGATSNGETATHSKKKGKAVDTGVTSDVPNPLPSGQRKSGVRERRQSWWLDVSSPTWNDMRELGKVCFLKRTKSF